MIQGYPVGESSGLIDGGRIAAGTILGTHIKGKEITAEKLAADLAITDVVRSSQYTPGAWSTTNSLAVGVCYSSAIVTKNRIYLLGGSTTFSTTAAVATVQTASIDSEGNIGSWSTTTSLPVTLAGSRSIKTNGYVYLLGGDTAAGGSQTTVYKAPINSDGTLGSWTTSVALPSASYGHMAVATSSRVYVFAYDPLYVMYSAVINSDGTLGSWTTGTAMSFRQGHSACVLTSSRLYLIGGRDYGTLQARVSYVSFSGGLNDYLSSSYS